MSPYRTSAKPIGTAVLKNAAGQPVAKCRFTEDGQMVFIGGELKVPILQLEAYLDDGRQVYLENEVYSWKGLTANVRLRGL